jgi:hypothetical protein
MEIAAIFRIASGWRVRSSGGTLVKPFCKPSELPYRWRASPLNEDGSLAKYLLSRKDEEAIREQCGEQASKYCDDLGE